MDKRVVEFYVLQYVLYFLELKNDSNREDKCDVIKIQICEITELIDRFRKSKMKKAPLPKISLSVQIGEKIFMV